MAWTKEQRAEYNKRWRKEHKEHISAYRREYYLKHILDSKPYDYEKVKANVRRWQEKNREHYRAYQREYQRQYRKRKALEGQI
jgi:hypothetical protein